MIIFSIDLLLLFCFLSNQEILYMIHLNLDLVYGICNTKMNTMKDKITRSHWCFQSNMISKTKWLKKLFYNFICVIVNDKFCAIAVSVNYTLFIIFFRGNKITCYCYVNFPLSVFLRSFMMSFNYSLISLRYSSIDSVSSLSLLLSNSI